MLAIGQALRDHGHTSVIAAPPVYASRVAALGLAFHPLRPDFPPEVLIEIFGDPVNGAGACCRISSFPRCATPSRI